MPGKRKEIMDTREILRRVQGARATELWPKR